MGSNTLKLRLGDATLALADEATILRRQSKWFGSQVHRDIMRRFYNRMKGMTS